MNKLCCDTVTLYHPDKATQTVRRTVLHRVVWQQGGRAVPDVGGSRFGVDYTLAPGDRLFPGEGPALTWADWPGFVPAARSDTVVVQYVLPMRRRGRPHHVEAGAWWSAGGTGVRSLTR